MSKQIVTSIRVQEELWKEAKIYAIRKGMTVTELLERLLTEELSQKKRENK
jgi:predicted DNA-binding ribbon-helix-helix protein